MFIGIDLGGSHIGIGLVNVKGEIIQKKEIDTTSAYEKTQVIKQCTDIINEILEENKISIYQVDSIGIGAPGTLTEDTIIRAENMGLYNFEIIKEFRKIKGYETIPIYLENDANAAAIAEFICGNLKGVKNGIFITVGTGIGAGIIINKKLYKGSAGMAGEIGHICIEKDGLLCNCGRKGCFEKYASMKNLRVKITKELELSKEISGKEIEVLLENKNEKVEKIFNETIEYLALGIASSINLLDPEKIILGGSVVYFRKWMLENLNRLVNEKSYNKNTIYPIELATVGNDAGIIGAALQKMAK